MKTGSNFAFKVGVNLLKIILRIDKPFFNAKTESMYN